MPKKTKLNKVLNVPSLKMKPNMAGYVAKGRTCGARNGTGKRCPPWKESLSAILAEDYSTVACAFKALYAVLRTGSRREWQQ